MCVALGGGIDVGGSGTGADVVAVYAIETVVIVVVAVVNCDVCAAVTVVSLFLWLMFL